jgi:hypothetical protein
VRRPPPQENYREALRRAFDALASRDLEEAASEAGGRARGRGVELELLGRKVTVDLERHEVRDDKGALLPDRVAAVVARYVAGAPGLSGSPGGEVGFAEVPDARGYRGPFRGRAIAPFAGRFGRDPQEFARAAEALGGRRVPAIEESGAIAFALKVFPHVELTYILHPGDEDLPAEGQVLFPGDVFEAFTVEDAVVFAELATRALLGKL